jgi:hypothetical protein
MLFVSLCYHPFFSQLDYSYDTVLNNLKLHTRPLQGMGKVMETGAKDTHIFIKTELGHHLPVIYSCSEQTPISFEPSPVE